MIVSFLTTPGFGFQVQHYGTSGLNRFKNKTLGGFVAKCFSWSTLLETAAFFAEYADYLRAKERVYVRFIQWVKWRCKVSLWRE